MQKAEAPPAAVVTKVVPRHAQAVHPHRHIIPAEAVAQAAALIHRAVPVHTAAVAVEAAVAAVQVVVARVVADAGKPVLSCNLNLILFIHKIIIK